MVELVVYWNEAMSTRCSFKTLKEMRKNVESFLNFHKKTGALSRKDVRNLKKLKSYLEVRMSTFERHSIQNLRWGI